MEQAALWVGHISGPIIVGLPWWDMHIVWYGLVLYGMVWYEMVYLGLPCRPGGIQKGMTYVLYGIV